MPPHDIEAAKTEINGKTVYKFTLQIPSYLAYMTYGPNRNYRRELSKAYSTRAPENGDASSEEEVLNFLNTLADAALPQAKEELNELMAFARKLDNIEDFARYDLAYYSEKLKKKKFDFDDTMTKPYFEQEKVLTGMLEIVSELFNVRFESVDVPVWHDCVKSFDIYENNALAGRIYFDLEARKEKRGGAWMHDWETHFVDKKGNTHLASAFVVCNFSPTTDTTPSLLRHDDVVTLFHEMGHAIHHLFGKTLMRKIKETKNFQAALGILRQVEFSLFDFILHQKLYQGEEVQALLDSIREKTSLLKPPSYDRFQHGFAHIFAGGYAAGYYSYKWAEVLSADAFFACLDEKEGFDKTKAKGYKEHILSNGGAKEMSELYLEWLGHKPQIESLLKLYEIA